MADPSSKSNKTILVAGAAGFLGSNVVEFLLNDGHKVIGVDNYQTGVVENLRHVEKHPNLTFIRHNIQSPLIDFPAADQIYHLACPASPAHYQKDHIGTLSTCFRGTENLLQYAVKHKARILLSSTSEVYGDPKVSPQPETYWGNVNPFGPRACYDEGKRVAEALAYAYRQQHGTDLRIARIFNTYGPGMRAADGRVIANFVSAALSQEPMRILGDGKATRSFQYVDDCVRGLHTLMNSDYSEGPVNIGNDSEITISNLTETVADLVAQTTRKPRTAVEYHPRVTDDPNVRKPDISLAKKVLDWRPEVSLEVGLKKTIQWHIKIRAEAKGV